MTYEETIDYLFNIAPLFQNIGAGAYKEGLDNSLKLDEHFGHPHKAYKCIHIGGTNGKVTHSGGNTAKRRLSRRPLHQSSPDRLQGTD